MDNLMRDRIAQSMGMSTEEVKEKAHEFKMSNHAVKSESTRGASGPLGDGVDARTTQVLKKLREKRNRGASMPGKDSGMNMQEFIGDKDELKPQGGQKTFREAVTTGTIVKSCADASCKQWKDNECSLPSIVMGPSHKCLSYGEI